QNVLVLNAALIVNPKPVVDGSRALVAGTVSGKLSDVSLCSDNTVVVPPSGR
ncbi:unnamed protein product, partial [marine sediment metagenome]